MSSYDHDVIVIGSGVGGLTCASLLAKEGLDVLVLERLNRIGGCCSNYNVNGFQPDVGAVFVIAKEMYDNYLQLMDISMEDFLDLRLLDPVYNTVLEDGTEVLLPRDIDEMEEVIANLNPDDVAGYRRYCAEMKKIHDLAFNVKPLANLGEYTKLSSLASMIPFSKMPAALPVLGKLMTRTMDRAINSYFKDERIRLMFGWENLYAALPAHRINGMFAMMTYTGRVGYYYPKGGMIAIPKAMGALAEKYGSSIRFGSEVKRIIVENGKARGVELESGEQIRAKAVISNAHSRVTYLDLVGIENLPSWYARTVRNQPCSIPAPTFYLGLKRKLPSVRAHMTVLLNNRRKFDDLWCEFYDRKLLYRADDGPMLVLCPSFDDEDLAPQGKQVLSVIYIAPYELKYYEWDEIKDAFTRELIESLERRAFPGLTDSLEWVDSVTPVDLERRLNVSEGAFFGLEMNGYNMGPFRPNYKSMAVKNLYLAGQCTNPGGGVPLVMLSGIMSSAMLLKDWNKLS